MSEVSTDAGTRSQKRAQAGDIFVSAGGVGIIVPPIFIVLFMVYVNATERSTVLLGFDGFDVLGVDVGWCGSAGFAAPISGSVLYCVFRGLYGGHGNPSREAGNEAPALAEAEALEDAA